MGALGRVGTVLAYHKSRIAPIWKYGRTPVAPGTSEESRFKSLPSAPHGHATRMIRYRDVPWTPSFFAIKNPHQKVFRISDGGVENFRDPGGINFLTRGVIFCVRGGGLFFVPLLCEFAQVVWVYLAFVCHLMMSFTKAHEIVII